MNFNFDFDAIQKQLEALPKNGTPAEYVSWFAGMIKALISLLSGLFKKDDAETESTTNA